MKIANVLSSLAIWGTLAGAVSVADALAAEQYNFSFGAAESYAAGDYCRWLVAGDFNGDGYADLATANEAVDTKADSVSVLINRGDGTYNPKVDYAVGGDSAVNGWDGPIWVGKGDFNRDGFLDLVSANMYEGSISVLMNSGIGTFNSQQLYQIELNGLIGGSVADVNNDNWLDIIIPHYHTGTVHVLINNQAGNFTTQKTFDGGSGANVSAVGDLNGDGSSDALIVRSTSGFTTFLNDGSGEFLTKETIADGAYFATIGDVNGDGKHDVLTVDGANIKVYLNDGSGALTLQSSIPTGISANSVELADINGDGASDVVVANLDINNGAPRVFVNDGTGNFTTIVAFSTPSNSYYTTTSDVDNDGLIDIISPNSLSDTISIYRQFVEIGTQSNDLLSVSSGDTGLGLAGNDQITAASGSSELNGGSGSDLLNGGAGGDVLIGGDGADTVVYDASTSGVTIDLLSGTASGGDATGDTLTSIENVVGSPQSDTVSGSAIDNVISTGDGNDTVAAGSGNDTVSTGAGSDIIVGGNGAGIDQYDGGLGIDTIRYSSAQADITVNLSAGSAYATSGNDAANIGTDTITGIENVVAGPFNDTMVGTSSNNAFDGGSGTDIVVFAGNFADYTVSYNSSTTAFTIADGVANRDGTDTGQGVENFQFADGTRSASSLSQNKITGTNTANRLVALLGGYELYGLGGNDTLIGNTGGDTLDGGTGADAMSGGDGDDVYIVDNASDRVTESNTGNSGTDTVWTTLTSYTLPANVENLIYIGTGNFSGNGNALVNNITGGPGRDALNGGTGVDTLNGLAGDDSYVIDTTDLVIEAVNSGNDTVTSSVTVTTLYDNVENLTLTGTAALNGTGNRFNNIIQGTSGANVLTGGIGEDTFIGGAGNDTFYGETSSQAGNDTDTVSFATSTAAITFNLSNTAAAQATGGAGSDRLFPLSSIENLIGGSAADNLTGTDGVNRISGGAGNDNISALIGADTVYGNAGRDSIDLGNDADADLVGYIVQTESAVGTTRDVIANFKLANDKIDLSAIDADTRAAAIGNQTFTFNNTTPRATSVWYAVSGANILVRGDVNGNTTADFEIQINGVANISAANIIP